MGIVRKGHIEPILSMLNPIKKWDFVPIGFNLSFDFTSLIFRFQKVGIEVKARDLFAEHPYIDMQHVLLLCNKGSFGGCTLERFAGKRYSGSKVIEWYDQKNYSAIENYIEDEADRFINLYRFLVLIYLMFGQSMQDKTK